MTTFSIAILAGGHSRRMGVDKALLPIGGRSILERLITQCQLLAADELFIVANQADKYTHLQKPIKSDIWPDKGSLGGLASAISHSVSPWTMTLACDMPFVQAPFLAFLSKLIPDTDADAIIPVWRGQWQPFHAIYRKSCLPTFAENIARGALKISSALEQLRLRCVEPPEYQRFDERGLSFYNVNTPTDLEEALTIATRA